MRFASATIAVLAAGFSLSVAAESSAQPNVMILFDNSGSMSDGIPYDHSYSYDGTANGATVYDRCQTFAANCSCAQTQAAWKIHTGSCVYTDANADGRDDRAPSYHKIGNRLNFDALPNPPKLDVAKSVIDGLMQESANDDMRFGLMALNGAYLPSDYTNPTQLAAYHSDPTVLKAPIGTDHDTLRGIVNTLVATGGTPLANRAIATAKHFANDGTFGGADPLGEPCQANFLVIMTDGRPQAEGNRALGSAVANAEGEFDYIENWLGQPYDKDGDGRDPDAAHFDPPPGCNAPSPDQDPCEYQNGGSDYLDDVAKKLFDNDLRPSLPGWQHVTTHTIGYRTDYSLLERTAAHGGGSYYSASSADELADAFAVTLDAIRSEVGAAEDRCLNPPPPTITATPTPTVTATATPTATSTGTPLPTATVTQSVSGTPVGATATSAGSTPIPTPTLTSAAATPAGTSTEAPTTTTTPTPEGTATPGCGVAPELGCRVPAVPGKASLVLTDKPDDAKDTIAWVWAKGSVTAKADFGDPTATTYYDLCVYDGTSTLVMAASVSPGGVCGKKACWKLTKQGFAYANKSGKPDGVQQLTLTQGMLPGKAKIAAKGKGVDLDMPPLPLTAPVRVQLRNTAGTCWEATYSAPKRNDAAQFKAKADVPTPVATATPISTHTPESTRTKTPTPARTATPAPTATGGSNGRYVDNGNGTVTDKQTGLQWEKKTGTFSWTKDCSTTPCSPHDVNSGYQWCLDVGHGFVPPDHECDNPGFPPDGGAFTDFLAKLNAGAGFAGHNDWRLPTAGELETILLAACPSDLSPCIDPVFGPTAPTYYWSSTTFVLPGDAWVVLFLDGAAYPFSKTSPWLVRAVRSGS